MHGECVTSCSRGKYIELVEYTKVFDARLNAYLQTTKVLTGISPNVQDDLIQEITAVLVD